MKIPENLRNITRDEFHNLQEGDAVYLKIGECICEAKVINEPFWNSDADEPGWEVETTNGFSDMYSLYVQENNDSDIINWLDVPQNRADICENKMKKMK
jgi:hypothetical protein